ncbi:PREDICTED: interaptin-like [Papilio polytes]|uniref:interaptin-like n=1 Tax=Papilio polytes TaxID=76194 RepID=UPI00067688A4|nr:PREDICTED: interaptin-like [Papilio polytes]
MANEIQLLNNISSEVDESKLRIFFTIQCSKAQASLLARLKNKIKEQKNVLNFITEGNKKIEVEIKLAEQELNNLIIAHNTIKSGNIETRKELLLKHEEEVEYSKRIEAGEKKYEQLWLSSKGRFENLPFVKLCLDGKNKIQLIENNINNLSNKCAALSDEIKLKKRAAQDHTQKHVIDLAKFIINDRPKVLKMIQERINEIQDMTIEIEKLQQPMMDSQYSKVKIIELEENSLPEKAEDNKKFAHDENDAILMPKLQLMDIDLDMLGVKLDQIKKIELNVTPTPEYKMNSLGYKMDVAHSSTTFNNKWESYCEQNKSYSDRKLIHILGDITLGRSQTLNIISKVDPNTLQNVNTIGSHKTPELLKICSLPEEKVNQSLKEIKENADDNEEQINVQSHAILDKKKKKVSFDLSMENVQNELTEIQNNMDVNAEDGKIYETLNSRDISLESDEGNDKLKDKILISHKLDTTPEFVYAKHLINKMPENKIITSKFFDATKVSEPNVISNEAAEQNTKIQEIKEDCFTKPQIMSENKTFVETNSKIGEDQQSKFQISGLLFDHCGSQVIPDSLNLSLNATGLDVDDSYPQCLDSSVLLSPKADMAMDGANITAMPQVPDFMSGIHKTGSSFFERLTDDNKPNSSTSNTGGNFNFNFSGEEKKKGRGFFSMFFNK